MDHCLVKPLYFRTSGLGQVVCSKGMFLGDMFYFKRCKLRDIWAVTTFLSAEWEWAKLWGRVLSLRKLPHILWSTLFSLSSFRVAKKRKALSLAQERKRDKVTRRPVRSCTSLTLAGLVTSMISWNLSQLDYMPFFVSMKTRNFPTLTLKEHLVVFKCMLYFLMNYRPSSKFAAWLRPLAVFTIMSSI